jgi:DNA repair photolyase
MAGAAQLEGRADWGNPRASVAPEKATLFPILQPNLTGIARLANEAPHADDGHLVEFRAMQARSILNKTVSKRFRSLEYAINPYRGCEFGCKYCYARYAHGFLAPKLASAPGDGAVGTVPGAAAGPGEWVSGPVASESSCAPTQPSPAAEIAAAVWPQTARAPQPDYADPLTFERLIFLKQNAAWLLEQELRRLGPKLKDREIAIGTATDPYQPIERRAEITRSLLEVFTRKEGLRIGIVTKSTLILRDLDLLTQIARRNTLVVHITITTPDADLARKLEPRAPRPDLRLAAVRKLREAGIVAGVLCCPLLPGITDSEADIDRMAELAAEAGASFFAANPLFLKACSRPTYLSFVREHFPSQLAQTQRRFALRDFAAPSYAKALARIVARACEKQGLNRRSRDTTLTKDTIFNSAPAVRPSTQRTAGFERKPPASASPLLVQGALFA